MSVATPIRSFPGIYSVGQVYQPLPGIKAQAQKRAPLSPTTAAQWTQNLSHLVAEVVAGKRHAAGLRRWVRPRAFTAISKHLAKIGPQHPWLIRTRISLINREVAEVILLFDDGHRVTAVAMRLQTTRGKWIVAEFSAL